MKTAISIPDNVFQSAESLADRMGISRSELYAKAVEAFIESNKNRGVTDALNDVYASASNSLDDHDHSLQIRSLNKDEW